jgi:hypothetical protein
MEVGGVVDQHVDTTEAIDGGLHRRLGVVGIGDVELGDQQVVGGAEGFGDCVGLTPRGDDGLAGRESSPRDVGAHAASGTGDEPHLLVTHDLGSFRWVIHPLPGKH